MIRPIIVIVVIFGLLALSKAAPRPPKPVDSKKEDQGKEKKEQVVTVEKTKDGEKVKEAVKINEDDYQQAMEFLRQEQDLAENIKSVDEKEFGHDNEAFRNLNKKLLDRYDEMESEEVAQQRQLEHQLHEIKERQEHPDTVFRPQHGNNAETDVAAINKRLRELAEKLHKTDDERHREFLRYELEKELMRKKELEGLSEEARKKAEEEHKKRLEDRKDHPKLHHPGSKKQLEEVWEKQDGLDKKDFNPVTFFRLHDINNDGFLDYRELESLFRTEIGKLLRKHDGTYDERELREETARMREHVANEIDTDKNGLVSFEEFMKSTKKKEFEQDESWETLDEDENSGDYNPEELEEYERRVREGINRGFNKDVLRERHQDEHM